MYTIDALIRDIEGHKVAFFLGAGASRCSEMSEEHQLPDGKEMKNRLYEHRYKEKNGDAIDYEKKFREEFKITSDYIRPELVWEHCLTKEGFRLTWHFPIIDKMFGKKKYIPLSYKLIAWLHLTKERRINQVITTNFDEKIEDSYKLLQQRNLYPTINIFTAALKDDFVNFSDASNETRTIFKLHGTLSKPYSIISSAQEMDKELGKEKFDALNNIFTNNDTIIFVGYACNDNDLFNSLLKISENKNKPKIIWVKRNAIDEKSNIYKLLKAFNPETNPEKSLYLCESYQFFLDFFDHFIDREKINLSLIKEQADFILENIIKQHDTPTIFHKDPIADIIYRKIKFPEEYTENIFKIINSCDIQRLRDIKQLSFAQYKFPCATHTRFSHSIGVAFLVSQVLTTNPNFSDVGKDDVKNTIYAALLHDVGHGPLGHVLDKFYDRRGKLNEHEEFTSKFVEEGLIDLNNVLKDIDLNLNFIKNLIVGKPEKGGHKKKKDSNLFLSWLITDYALDLDRIDFLMRDLAMTNYSSTCKSPYFHQSHYSDTDRNYHRNRLSHYEVIMEFISCLNIATFDDLDEDLKSKFSAETRLLYLDNKGKCNLDDLLSYLLNLYIEMYTNVYYNDRIAAAEAMMAKALNIAYDMGDIDRSSLYTFTDSEMFSYLEKLENDLIRELVYSVKYRKIFRSIIEFELNLPKGITAAKLEEKIIKEFKIKPNDFDNLLVVNIPRRKEIKNLYIKKENKVILYPKISEFKKKFDTIKGKIFVNPNNSLFSDLESKEKILKILKDLGIESNIIGISKKPVRGTHSYPLEKFF
ncbi:MAG: SIR2 family protein [Methanoregula sp.]|jgi:HD superfamily phosphohydrolase|nr:SIR2 family protein [Methanoregula sp.]